MTWSSLAALVLVLVLAPLLPGVATKTRCWLTGRRGPPILQLYFDLAKLARKRPVYSRTVTWVFHLAPMVVVASTVTAALLLPLDGDTGLIAFTGDLIAFAASLALGRFALILAGLDTGSSLEGMGASREATFGTLAEPALLLAFAALVVGTGDLTLRGMLGAAPVAGLWSRAAPTAVLVAMSLFLVLLAENARVPVDDPATHLELTMIHEVMVLDHSGPGFGLMLYGSALKLALFAALLTSLVLPRTALPDPAAAGLLGLGLIVVAAAVGVVESVMARLRLVRVPQFLASASAFAVLALLLVLIP